MVKPRSFRGNEETADSNAFQCSGSEKKGIDVAASALKEFENFGRTLVERGVDVVLKEEPPGVDTPDAIFPNNWFCVLPGGHVFIFPMLAKNRQREVHPEWVSDEHPLTDLRQLLKPGLILEGTGSLILDHRNKSGYGCISNRTDQRAVEVFSKKSGYEIFLFDAVDQNGTAFYHTNVMMALGDQTTLVCLESVKDSVQRKKLKELLETSGRRVVSITQEQVLNFVGNMLMLKSKQGDKLWICSAKAFQSLSGEQKEILSKDGQFVFAPLDTIETYGGGSARCMLAELF